MGMRTPYYSFAGLKKSIKCEGPFNGTDREQVEWVSALTKTAVRSMENSINLRFAAIQLDISGLHWIPIYRLKK